MSHKSEIVHCHMLAEFVDDASHARRGKNMNTASPVVQSDPDILGGTPVFVGTRVPFRTLLDYLEAGDSLNVFLDDFPSVSREQAVAALQLAGQMLVDHARPA
jgi:uncharacterized protein (DUF433 family)